MTPPLPDRTHLSKEAGFTFIEIVLSLLILATVTLGVLQLKEQSFSELRRAKYEKGAYVTMLQKLYEIEPIDPAQTYFLRGDYTDTVKTSWNFTRTNEIIVDPFDFERASNAMILDPKKAVLALVYETGEERVTLEVPFFYLLREQKDVVITSEEQEGKK